MFVFFECSTAVLTVGTAAAAAAAAAGGCCSAGACAGGAPKTCYVRYEPEFRTCDTVAFCSFCSFCSFCRSKLKAKRQNQSRGDSGS